MKNTLLFSLTLFCQSFLFSQNDIANLPDLKGNNIYFNYVDFLVDDSSFFFKLILKDEFNSSVLDDMPLGKEITNSNNNYRLYEVPRSYSEKHVKTENLNDLKVYNGRGAFISNVLKYEIQLLIDNDETKNFIAVFKINDNPAYSGGSYFVSANVDSILPEILYKAGPRNSKEIKNQTYIHLLERNILENKENNEKYKAWYQVSEFNYDNYVLVLGEGENRSQKNILYNYSKNEIVKVSNIKEQGRMFSFNNLPGLFNGKQLFLVNFSRSNSFKDDTSVILYHDGNEYVFSKNGSWIN